MSQAKVDRYKQEKANRKKIMAKEKAMHTCGVVAAWAILIAILGWAGYTGYQMYEDSRPVKSFYVNNEAVEDYLQSLSTEE